MPEVVARAALTGVHNMAFVADVVTEAGPLPDLTVHAQAITVTLSDITQALADVSRRYQHQDGGNKPDQPERARLARVAGRDAARALTAAVEHLDDVNAALTDALQATTRMRDLAGDPLSSQHPAPSAQSTEQYRGSTTAELDPRRPGPEHHSEPRSVAGPGTQTSTELEVGL
ncbi:hypothetical protein APR04_001732 [Promicromonospora umidemergens]|uniref:PE family protein n=3 Tax=Promicromonospora umidemergens TaxID=629679 RepID=A0ABP8XFQ4_9MICO|nr:hypothetical protein [Promicromonospora umidemergens]